MEKLLLILALPFVLVAVAGLQCGVLVTSEIGAKFGFDFDFDVHDPF